MKYTFTSFALILTVSLHSQVAVEKEIEDVFSNYVQYWSDGDFDKISEEIYTAPLTVYLQDSILILQNKNEVKKYLISTFKNLEKNNYGFSKRTKWDYFRRENNIVYIEMHYTRFLKDSSIMKPKDRYSAYIMKKNKDKFKISALIPFTPLDD